MRYLCRFINFFPTIVGTLGYPQTETLLLSAPPYVFAAILGIVNSRHSDKTKERWMHVVVGISLLTIPSRCSPRGKKSKLLNPRPSQWPQVFCSIGFIISAATLNVAARYTSTFLMMSVYGSFGCILSWVSTTLPRPSGKRAVAYAVVNAGSNLASIYASYFYASSQGPMYWQANVANVAFAGACVVLATVLRFYLAWRNRLLDRAAEEDARVEGSAMGSRARDLGKRWQCHPDYRYTL